MEVWKIIFLSKWVICMFHVNLPGCNVIYSSIIQIILPSMNNSSFLVHAIWVSSASDVAQPHTKKEFHPKKHGF